VAVDDLDLLVPAGGVHGFLGPNGSGKTTTIRMVLGLVRPDAGELRVLGADVRHDLARVIGRVGAIVEKPQLFPSFTGRRNLEVLAPLGAVRAARIDECLDVVGLADRADDLVRGYSLGMLQRLAIAAALLKDPALLILDEPTNGLDPAGMVEVRELLRRLGTEGRTTVFLSSHLLAEVEQVCTSVTILDRGRRIVSGPVAEVLAGAARGSAVRVVVDDPVAAADLLRRHGRFQVEPAGPALVVEGAPGPAAVNALLGRHGIWASEVGPVAADLETAFLRLTGEAP
jgi:ABC-2 type transport system ATP-binding protein